MMHAQVLDLEPHQTAVSIDSHRIHLTRESAFSLKVGGMRRMRMWLDKPHNTLVEERLGSETITINRWSSRLPSLSAGIFLGRQEALSEPVWSCLEDTAFAGIPYESWDSGPDGRFADNALSVPAEVWIGELDFLVSRRPFAGSVPFEIMVTGPYSHRTEWYDPAEARPSGDDALLAWFRRPTFQPAPEGELCPFTGRIRRSYWSGEGGDQAISLSVLEAADLREIYLACQECIGDASSGWAVPDDPPRNWCATTLIHVSLDTPPSH